jgi:hypothetical protein
MTRRSASTASYTCVDQHRFRVADLSISSCGKLVMRTDNSIYDHPARGPLAISKLLDSKPVAPSTTTLILGTLQIIAMSANDTRLQNRKLLMRVVSNGSLNPGSSARCLEYWSAFYGRSNYRRLEKQQWMPVFFWPMGALTFAEGAPHEGSI